MRFCRPTKITKSAKFSKYRAILSNTIIFLCVVRIIFCRVQLGKPDWAAAKQRWRESKHTVLFFFSEMMYISTHSRDFLQACTKSRITKIKQTNHRLLSNCVNFYCVNFYWVSCYCVNFYCLDCNCVNCCCINGCVIAG